jgi:bifunctional enzyme CysN/CysC
MAVTLTLDDEIDISRGDMIIGGEQVQATIADKFKATIVWMTEKSLSPGRQYTIKLATRSVSGSITLIHHRIDVNTLEHHDANELKLNEIGSCTVTVNAPVVFDPYKKNRGTGSFIIIDRLTNGTVGAGMISGATDEDSLKPVNTQERAARFSQVATAITLQGAKGREMACLLERKLFDNGHATTILETQETAGLIQAIKNAGLICLSVNGSVGTTDLSFDCETLTADDIYSILKEQKILF